MHTAQQNSTAHPLPLERYRLFDSHDLDEAREFVGRVFCPHDLATLRPGAQLDACHHSVPLHRDDEVVDESSTSSSEDLLMKHLGAELVAEDEN